MKNDDLETQANAILRLFGPKEMTELYDEMVDFMYIWEGGEHEDKVLQEQVSTSLDKLRLLRTAIALSRLADLYSRKFDKIARKFPNFWKRCDRVAEDLRKEVNDDADKALHSV